MAKRRGWYWNTHRKRTKSRSWGARIISRLPVPEKWDAEDSSLKIPTNKAERRDAKAARRDGRTRPAGGPIGIQIGPNVLGTIIDRCTFIGMGTAVDDQGTGTQIRDSDIS